MSRIQSLLHHPVHRLIELAASRRNPSLFRAPGHYNKPMLSESLVALWALLASLGPSRDRRDRILLRAGK